MSDVARPPSEPARPGPSRAWSDAVFWAVLLAVTAWRCLAAARLTICYDEAYYHYWSLFPQLSYLDHPPLVAWAMALSGSWFGNSAWTVRCWPLVAGTVFVLIGRALARRMYDAAVGNRAGILLALIPVFVGNGLLMTPDTLLGPCWAATVALAWIALREPSPRSWWLWAAAGVCAGVGLLSKYSMILVFAGLGLYWLAVPADRRKVFWGTAVCGMTALLVFSPVIVWNAQHDWVSFGFQLRHGLAQGVQPRMAETVPGYLGGLLLIATPLLGLLVLWSGVRGPWRGEPRRVFLAACLWAVLGVFGYSALKTDVQANWGMVAFVTGAILVAADWPAYATGWRRAALAMLIAVDGAGMAYLLLPAQYPLRLGSRSLDAVRMREFIVTPALAEAVRHACQASGAQVVCPATHQLFGVISFYAPDLRDRLVLSGRGRRRFPWIEAERGKGRTVLLVSSGRKTIDWAARGGFAGVRDAGCVELPFKGDRTLTVRFAVGTQFAPDAVVDTPARRTPEGDTP